MAQETASPPRQHSNAYNIFILVLTVFSLLIMVAMFLPLSDTTISLLQVYDNHHNAPLLQPVVHLL